MKKIFKIITITAFSFFVFSCTQEQKGYTINGTVKGAPDGQKVILNGFDYKAIDSTTIKQEKFTFTGSVETPFPASISSGYVRGTLILNNVNFETNLVSFNSYVSGNAENVPWINTVDYKAFKGETALGYGVKGIPAAFLINTKGIIVATGDDAKMFALDEKLEELLWEN